MNFNEQRVRTAFDGVTPQWSSMKEEDHEEWETIMEMLHDDAIDEIQEKIDGILDITATEVLEEADWTELIRRLRVEYPYPDGECGRCGEDNNKGGTALWCDLCADCDEAEGEWRDEMACGCCACNTCRDAAREHCECPGDRVNCGGGRWQSV